MGLDLIHGGLELVVKDEIHDTVRMEVAHPDRFDAAFLVQLLHHPRLVVRVARGAELLLVGGLRRQDPLVQELLQAPCLIK